MQPHARQKSRWMNFGTVSFSNLLPLPNKDAYSRHFSEFPQSYAAGHFDEKCLYVEDGFAGAGHPSYSADSSAPPSSVVLREKRRVPGDLIPTVSEGWAWPGLEAWESG